MPNWFTKAAGFLTSPVFRLTDRAAFRAFLGGGESHSGKIVTVDSALQLSTVWACVRVLARTISSLPLELCSVDAAGNKAALTTHPLYAILHDQPNADMTAVDFWEAMIASLLLWGNCYAEVARASDGRVIALTPIPSDRVAVRVLDDGSTVYVVSGRARSYELDSSQIFHIKGFSTGGRHGLSVIGYARHSFGSALAADETAGRMFANGMRPSGALTTEQALKPEQRDRLRERMEKFKGSSHVGEFLILESGLGWTPFAIPPDEAQLLETRQFNVEEICRWFDVPPALIGVSSGSSSRGTTLEQQQIAFYTHALLPWLTKITQTVRMSLLQPGEKSTMFARHDLGQLLQADSAGRAALYASFAQNGLATRNELRARESMSPMPEGDDLTVQSNLVKLADLGKQPPGQTPAGFGLAKPTDTGPAPGDPQDTIRQ